MEFAATQLSGGNLGRKRAGRYPDWQLVPNLTSKRALIAIKLMAAKNVCANWREHGCGIDFGEVS